MLYGKDIKYYVELYTDNYYDIINKFDCTNDKINKYLKEKAYSELQDGRAVTSLFLNENKDRIIGFYSIRGLALVLGTGEKDNHFYSAIEIKMFAIDREYQDMPYAENSDKTLSDYLLSDVVDNINDITTQTCGAEFIVLYAVPSSVKFYKKYGFNLFNEFIRFNTDSFLEDCKGMFLPLVDSV